ncbi:TPA: hypothetical protein ACH3X1_014410 [Trebouxia sp. C0004]
MQEEQAAAAAGAQSEIGEQATQSDKGQPSEQAEVGQDDLAMPMELPVMVTMHHISKANSIDKGSNTSLLAGELQK